MESLSPETATMLRNFLMECDEFTSNLHLRAVFTTRELLPFLPSLPEANNTSNRVDFFINFGLRRKQADGKSVLVLFLEVLETRIPPIDQRHSKLVNIIYLVNGELLSGNQIHTIRVEIHKANPQETQPTMNSNLGNVKETEKVKYFEHGYALIIGVGADLPVTVKDANAIYEILIDNERCGYKVKNVKLLTQEAATRNNILAGLDWLSEQARKDKEATIIFYFSGHGGMMPEYHLVPFGYNPSRISQTAISGAELTQKFQAIFSRKQLILLDCCHAGGMTEVRNIAFSKSPVPPEINEILTEGSGRVLIASSRRDEVSYTGTPYSVYTQALRESLAGYGTSEYDGFAYIADMALYIGRWVPNRTSDKQHPILKISAADNFAVAYYAGSDKDPKDIDDVKLGELRIIQNNRTEISRRYQNILKKYQENLLEIEEQMSHFYDQSSIPLDLRRTRQEIIKKISEVEITIENFDKHIG